MKFEDCTDLMMLVEAVLNLLGYRKSIELTGPMIAFYEFFFGLMTVKQIISFKMVFNPVIYCICVLYNIGIYNDKIIKFDIN